MFAQHTAWRGRRGRRGRLREGGRRQQTCFGGRQRAGLADRSEPAASIRGVADQIRALLGKAAAVAGDISSNCFLANELEEPRGSPGRMAPTGCAGRPLLL